VAYRALCKADSQANPVADIDKEKSYAKKPFTTRKKGDWKQLILPLSMKTPRGLMTLATAPTYQRLPALTVGLSSLIAVIRILF